MLIKTTPHHPAHSATRTVSPSDCGYAAALLVLGGALLYTGASVPPAGAETQMLEASVAWLASAAGVAIVSWWIAALTLALCAEILDRRGRAEAASRTARLAPDFMRRLASALLGLNLIVLPVAAHASSTPDPAPTAPTTTTQPLRVASATRHDVLISPLWNTRPATVANPTQNTADAANETFSGRKTAARTPGWTPAAQPVSGGLIVPEAKHSPATAPRHVAVVPGDSLWTIAATALGPMATDVEIAAEWPRWYQQNQHLIGSDPSLILPGQVLQSPAQSGP